MSETYLCDIYSTTYYVDLIKVIVDKKWFHTKMKAIVYLPFIQNKRDPVIYIHL
jgi:hypothetical protein